MKLKFLLKMKAVIISLIVHGRLSLSLNSLALTGNVARIGAASTCLSDSNPFDLQEMPLAYV